MAFFGTPTVEQPSEEEMLGLLQMPKTQGGILGFLRNPAVSAALGGMSRGFTQAAAAGTPTGLGLATGLAGGAQAFGAWEEAQAKAAAERVNQIAQARRGETDYRYQLGLIAKRLMRDEGMDEESAYIAAQQEMAGRPFEQRKELSQQGFSQSQALALLKYKLDNNLEITKRDLDMAYGPQLAGAQERAKAEAAAGVEAEKDVRKAESTVSVIDEIKTLIPQSYVGGGMNSISRALTSVGMAPDDEKAQNTAKIQALATQLKFMAKPPGLGAMTDSEWRIITDAIGDPTTGDKGTYAAALDALRYALEGRMPPDSVREAYGGESSKGEASPTKQSAPSGEQVWVRDPKTGKMARSQ